MTMASKRRRLAELERRQQQGGPPPQLVIIKQDLDDPSRYWQDDRLLTDAELRALRQTPGIQLIRVTYDREAHAPDAPGWRPEEYTERKVDYRRDVWALAPPTRRNTPGA